jgi:phosphorylase kinase alpha/beta subunit
LVHTSYGLRLVPEHYTVHLDLVDEELANPGSQEYVASGRIPFMWAQSLYVIGQLLREGFIACGELDPINRRLSSFQRPEVIVQVVVLAKDDLIKGLLQQHGYVVRTLKEVGLIESLSIEVHPARVLSHLYTYLGRNEKLGLTGRRNRDVGILTTSKLYKIQGKIFAFTPQRFDFSRNYMDCDTSLMMTTLEYGLNYLSKCWTTSGRPTISLVMGPNMLDNGELSLAMQSALKKLKGGYINGTRVVMGQYEQFLRTTCITNLSFLGSIDEGNPDSLQPEVQKYLSQQLGRPVSSVFSFLGETKAHHHHHHGGRRKVSMRGSIRRSRSKYEGTHPKTQACQ